jgi:hypothetical protein
MSPMYRCRKASRTNTYQAWDQGDNTTFSIAVEHPHIFTTRNIVRDAGALVDGLRERIYFGVEPTAAL